MTSSGTAGQPWTSDVDCHDGVPGLCGEVPDGSVAHYPGVVDQNVDSPPFIERTFDHGLCVGFIDNVAVVRDSRPTSLGDRRDSEICVLAGTFTVYRSPKSLTTTRAPYSANCKA